MANHKSAEKRARQSLKRNARNTQVKNSVKTLEKRVMKALNEKSKELPELLKAYVSRAMAAVSKGALRKETVSRKIGRISSRVHQASSK